MALQTPGEIVSGSASLMGSDAGLWSFAALAGLALAVSSVILAFIYVWGTLFRNSQLLAYVKSELYELFMTGAMIPLLFIATGAMASLTVGSIIPQDIAPSGSFSFEGKTITTDIDTSLYDASAHYYQRVETDMSGWLTLNYVMNVYVDQVASITPYARPLGVGLVASPLAGLASPIKQLLYNATVALAIAFIINHAQMMVYIFSVKAFLEYYLPMGIFLRAFTPTRRIGGTLMGVAAAFLFVFPALSVISYTMFYSHGGGPLLSFRSLMTQYMQDGCQPDSDPDGVCFTGHITNFYKDNFSGLSNSLTGFVTGVFGGIGNLLQSMVGNLTLMLIAFPVSLIAWAFSVGFIMPAVNLIVFVQAAKVLSKSFGDEVDISSLTRLI
ncbi:MAG: hypothetical protein AB1295_03175 [Candidatus Micrarchaeota archaeon]